MMSMHFTLQQLKLFEAVARNGSYTRAAEELHLSQPAVSIQIKRLEEQIGLALFERVGKKIFTTTAGDAIFRASKEILDNIIQLKNTVKSLKCEIKGPLQLSVVSSSKYFMPLLLGNFLKQHADVEPKMKFTNRGHVIERLTNNEDDFVVMEQIPAGPGLEAHPFSENILVIAAPPDHPLADRQNISLEELSKERFLEREEGSCTRIVFDRILEENHVTMKPYLELGNSEAIKQGVMAGLGLAVLSLHSLQLERNAGKLIVLDVEGFPVKRQWYLVHRKGKQHSLAARTFFDFILQNSHKILEQS